MVLGYDSVCLCYRSCVEPSHSCNHESGVGQPDSITANLIYAILIIIIAVLVTVWIARAASRAVGEEIEGGMVK